MTCQPVTLIVWDDAANAPLLGLQNTDPGGLTGWLDLSLVGRWKLELRGYPSLFDSQIDPGVFQVVPVVVDGATVQALRLHLGDRHIPQGVYPAKLWGDDQVLADGTILDPPAGMRLLVRVV